MDILSNRKGILVITVNESEATLIKDGLVILRPDAPSQMARAEVMAAQLAFYLSPPIAVKDTGTKAKFTNWTRSTRSKS
jgi:hypothetical protein